MLRRVVREGHGQAELVRGDGLRPPFRPHAFREVVALGNAVGFAGRDADRLWQAAGRLVTPAGRLVLEVVAGPGERSRYLGRLPPTSLPRLLHAPVQAVLTRVDREGFVSEPSRKADPGTFRRYDPFSLTESLEAQGWGVDELLAVAPALGADPERLEPLEMDPVAWARLLELEELLGRREERLRGAAAVLLCATAPSPPKRRD